MYLLFPEVIQFTMCNVILYVKHDKCLSKVKYRT
ncbi:hypothetical protein BOFL111202_18010 [Bordetella flabilis]